LNLVEKHKSDYEENKEYDEDLVEIKKDVNSIEEKLDKCIPRYCGFLKNHPMEGITYNVKKSSNGRNYV